MRLPQEQCVSQALELARPNKNTMDFLVVSLRANVTKFRADEEYNTVLSAADEVAKIANMRDKFLTEISKKTWTATATDIDLEKIKVSAGDYLMVPAVEGIQEINESLGQDHKIADIAMIYYMDDNAQFNRGYIVNNQVVDENIEEHKKMVRVIDQMFHSWLVSHDYISDAAGDIYKRKKDGELGEKADTNTLVALLNSPETGFQQTVKKVDPNINVNLLWSPPEELQASNIKESSDTPQSSRGKGG